MSVVTIVIYAGIGIVVYEFGLIAYFWWRER